MFSLLRFLIVLPLTLALSWEAADENNLVILDTGVGYRNRVRRLSPKR
jgi:hypothetical protein